MYLSGTASSFAALQTAIFDACTANGFTKDGNVIYKQDGYFELTAETGAIRLDGGQGQSGGTLSNKSPYGCRIGGSYINFPLNYEINIFDDPSEVYVVINYNSDYYQQLSFGTSSVEGSGKKAWLTGSFSSSYASTNGMNVNTYNNYIIKTYKYVYYGLSFGFFVSDGWGSPPSLSLTNVEGNYEWVSPRNFNSGSADIVASLLNSCPSAFNSATPLLPIKAVIALPDNGQATIVNPANARFCRIDYNDPGSIITYGKEKWKVYPWLKKNAAVRNGQNFSTSSNVPDHSGTFGYAIKYTGN